MPGRQPWRRSPVRVQHAVSTHSGPAVQPVRCPASSPSGVRSPGFVVWGPAVRPCGVHPSSVRPCGVHLSSVQPCGVRPVRPDASSPPTSGGGVGDQMGAAGQPAPRERVEVPVGAAPSSGSVSGRGLDDRGRRYRSRALVGGVSAADPAGLGEGGGGRACPLPDQAGQVGVRAHVAGGCAVSTEQAAARSCRTGGVAAVLGWVRDHGEWLSWSLRSGWTGLARPMGLPASGEAAAPARPRLVAGIPDSLPTAL
jgi:hypothetical protein